VAQAASVRSAAASIRRQRLQCVGDIGAVAAVEPTAGSEHRQERFQLRFVVQPDELAQEPARVAAFVLAVRRPVAPRPVQQHFM
jgi:hypothetical protein